ncbi:regulatory protein RecX [Acinetobacter sp. ANC 3832]|uniref:regulatory protein RecX n=1 Tax=Acinetobacter sp. ANC 3832 TaxID=1977874 RepID=UPI000A34D78D|nr:regulatory protein RecX [Acinetobacter sp. ANC 3832]OTG92897.1 RecX family transcriptional regulator [Acinetobacter sp. ANC 3832]
MDNSKFPKMLNYEALKQQFGDEKPIVTSQIIQDENLIHEKTLLESDSLFNDQASEQKTQRPGLTGSRLRSYAFAVLTRKEYSKADLIKKLALYAEHQDEVIQLVDELARENYQSDQRVAEMIVRSQMRKGKGPNRIKLALNAKKIDKALVQDDMKEVDWYEEAYQLKVKKYGTEVSKDPRIKAKQIRFLQYRGFEMDAIMKAIMKQQEDFD